MTPEQRRLVANERSRKYVAEKRAVLMRYKLEHGCVDCGTREERLDFDHRPGTVKEFNLGRPRCSWERMWLEVAKCEVRCAACHTRRHARDRTHCRRGHPFDAANTYVAPDGERQCRTCARERERARRPRIRSTPALPSRAVPYLDLEGNGSPPE